MAEIVKLDDLEKDLLGEAFNIGIGNAANALSQMVDQEVEIKIPEVKIFTVDEMVEELGGGEVVLCGVSQQMSGVFKSKALLIFPESNSIEVVKLMLGSTVPYETMIELHQDSLLEIGNILLNACIAAVSDFLSMRFEVGLPEFHTSPPLPLLLLIEDTDLDCILNVKINLKLVESNITGVMGFILGPESFSILRKTLNEFLSKL